MRERTNSEPWPPRPDLFRQGPSHFVKPSSLSIAGMDESKGISTFQRCEASTAIAEGQTFLRSAHWIVSVLVPGRPMARELSQWKKSIAEAASEPDPKRAARLARPSSLLAERYAEHFSNIAAPATEEDRRVGAIGVNGDMELRHTIWGLARKAGLLGNSGLPAAITLTAWQRFAEGFDSETQAHTKLREFLDEHVTTPDLELTERKLREKRQRLLIQQTKQRLRAAPGR